MSLHRNPIYVDKYDLLAAVFYGLLTIALAYLAKVLGQSLLQMALSLLGIVGGPMMATFILGMFVPFGNRWVCNN